MPQQITTNVENNFTKGLITESTGLNFPENAATDTSNCEYTLVGDVTRRLGVNIEVNGTAVASTDNVGNSSYVWTNVGGDGNTKLLVRASGNSVRFYTISAATTAAPLSTQLIVSSIDISAFVANGGTFNSALECTFADGNGYLFIYHPSCDPIFCTYTAGTVTANPIIVQIRDFNGIVEPGISVNTRPNVLTAEHQYNLNNQGWAKNPPWSALSSSVEVIGTGSRTFTVPAGLTITLGDFANIINTVPYVFPAPPTPAGSVIMSGIVTAYTATNLTINVTFSDGRFIPGTTAHDWNIVSNADYITQWKTAIGNYPSNSDVWWYYKDNTDVFNPTATIGNVTISNSQAPSGHYVLNAFDQQRSGVSAITGLTPVTTTVRPKVGAWFQGRVWYAGVDAQQAPTGDAAQYTWTENIYFSQIVVNTTDFGLCYQNNDGTSETLFDLLPTDGGIIQIQGCGSINKLFPIQNGMLVHATNGIWFITGSQGIGFSANDYTITKISNVQSISPTSFVNVNGLPYFWNEEGIYSVEPSKGGGLEVAPLTVGTILTFYNDIPKNSKQFVRGDYHPIDYVIQWTYRSTQETSINDRYDFDTILNYNTYNKAFFPYTISSNSSNAFINGVNYISYPQIGSTVPDPGFKYPCSFINPAGSIYDISIADEHDDDYIDWAFNAGGANYVSFFVTGYKIRGQAIKKFQPQFIQVYSRTNNSIGSYKIQGIWDYANDRNSNRWSSIQLITNSLTKFDTVFRRHKIRGQGFALQFKIISADGLPFDIQGWAVVDTVNQGT